MTNAREQIFGAIYGHDCRNAETAGTVADQIIDRLGREIIVKLKSEVGIELESRDPAEEPYRAKGRLHDGDEEVTLLSLLLRIRILEQEMATLKRHTDAR